MKKILLLGLLLFAGCGFTGTDGGSYVLRDTDGRELIVQNPSSTGKQGRQEMRPVSIKPSGEVTFGGTRIDQVVESLHGSPILLYAGIGVIIGAALIAWITGRWMMAAFGAVLGAGLIGLGYYPWIGGIAAGAAVLCGFGYVVWVMVLERWEGKALRQTYDGIDRAEACLGANAEVLRSCLGKAQDRDVQELVADIRKSSG